MSTYITLSEAKTHLRIDYNDDDTYIQSLCDMVEEVVLNEISGSFKGEGTVSYTSGSTSLTGDETNFMDFTTGDIVIIKGDTVKYGLTVDSITDNSNLDFTCGFSTTEDGLEWSVKTGLPLVNGSLPLGLKQAMLLLVGHFYQNREIVLIGINCMEIPVAYKYLISPFKYWSIS